jgi:hypothetical protein
MRGRVRSFQSDTITIAIDSSSLALPLLILTINFLL